MPRRKIGRPRKSSVNRSEAIRAEYQHLGPSAAPGDVIAALAKKEIKVSANLVQKVRHRMLQGKRKPGRKRGRGRPRAMTDMVSISALIDARRMSDKLGGIEEAKKALEALARLS